MRMEKGVIEQFHGFKASVYIQHSERQQLGLERRFLKYSEIQGENGKLWEVYTPAHKGKRKNRNYKKH